MEPLNPYTPGAGTPPLHLVGRDEQLVLIENLADYVEAGRMANPMIYLGLRGVGKTSLLYAVRDVLQRRGWLAGYYEVRRDVEAGQAVRSIVQEGAGLSTGGLRKSLATGVHSIEGLKLRLGATGFSFEVDSKAVHHDSGDPFPELVGFLRNLGQTAARSGVGVALLIDELQIFRKRDIAVLVQALSALRGEPVVFIGAGLPHLPSDLSRANTYAERFRYEEIARLDETDARLALTGPALDQGVTLEAAALDRLVELSDGYPFFLQLYASEAWEAARGESVITVDHVERAVSPVQRQLDSGLYASRYNRLSSGERAYVDAMVADWDDAATAPFSVTSSVVAGRLEKDLAQLSTTRDRIIKKGIIHSSTPGRLEFSVPGFAQYVRRQQPTDE